MGYDYDKGLEDKMQIEDRKESTLKMQSFTKLS